MYHSSDFSVFMIKLSNEGNFLQDTLLRGTCNESTTEVPIRRHKQALQLKVPALYVLDG